MFLANTICFVQRSMKLQTSTWSDIIWKPCSTITVAGVCCSEQPDPDFYRALLCSLFPSIGQLLFRLKRWEAGAVCNPLLECTRGCCHICLLRWKQWNRWNRGWDTKESQKMTRRHCWIPKQQQIRVWCCETEEMYREKQRAQRTQRFRGWTLHTEPTTALFIHKRPATRGCHRWPVAWQGEGQCRLKVYDKCTCYTHEGL